MGGAALLALAASGPAEALIININPGAGLTGTALTAFNDAAGLWEDIFTHPVTVNIDANLAPLSPSVIGTASSVVLVGPYDLIADAMRADAAAEPDDGVVASLPTSGQFSAFVPTGFGLSGSLGASKANLKAMGFSGLDAFPFTPLDATITFNSNFAFDFDNSDGVGAGLLDFTTVAAHEVGHALGFLSIVDRIDSLVDQNLIENVNPRALDLFRFGFDADGFENPSTLTNFTNFGRNLVPGVGLDRRAFFDDLSAEFLMSTGVSQGDGRQASHWRDNGITGTLIGVMDPTLATSQVFPIKASDIRALDVIGWDHVAAPEPAAILLLGFGLGAFAMMWRRRPRRAMARR